MLIKLILSWSQLWRPQIGYIIYSTKVGYLRVNLEKNADTIYDFLCTYKYNCIRTWKVQVFILFLQQSREIFDWGQWRPLCRNKIVAHNFGITKNISFQIAWKANLHMPSSERYSIPTIQKVKTQWKNNRNWNVRVQYTFK